MSVHWVLLLVPVEACRPLQRGGHLQIFTPYFSAYLFPFFPGHCLGEASSTLSYRNHLTRRSKPAVHAVVDEEIELQTTGNRFWTPAERQYALRSSINAMRVQRYPFDFRDARGGPNEVRSLFWAKNDRTAASPTFDNHSNSIWTSPSRSSWYPVSRDPRLVRPFLIQKHRRRFL